MIQEYLAKVVRGEDLTETEAMKAMAAMMEGRSSSVQTAAFLTALRMKGETVEELTGLATMMRKKALPVSLPLSGAVDTCGTGGDGGRTFNISTAAAIVAAAAGVPVAKHGNRAASSRSGSADVLEALGVPIQLSPAAANAFLKKLNICFLFAPLFHQGMKAVMPTRRELGYRTCFNLLGPLVHPGKVRYQLVGVFDPALTEKIAQVLLALGTKRALVVAGLDGIDEISPASATQVSEVKDGKVSTYQIYPEDLGISRSSLAAIAGGDAQENAKIIRQIFAGERGPRRDVVVMNAGAVLYLAGKAPTLSEGVILAAETIDRGAAEAKLKAMIRYGEEKKYVS